ncbi:MAG TPA: ATP-binding protein [Bryobacteraceae bacterium]|nr:ATP-binding protein [Bryobacteraceae bacterium]
MNNTPSLRSGFADLRRRLKSTPVLDGPLNFIDAAEELRFQLALRDWCEPAKLLPIDLDDETRVAVLDAVAHDCHYDAHRDRRWLLLDSVRTRVLQSRKPDTIRKAVIAAYSETADAVTRAFWRLLVNPSDAPDSQSAEELRAMISVITWVGDGSPLNYTKEALQWLLDKRTRIDEYHRIVSGGVYGRRAELDRLSAWLAAPLAVLTNPRYTLIYGAGGIGKSTLISAAALSVLESSQTPALVHLDFDRADLDPTRSSSLDLELLRQVGMSDWEMHQRLSGIQYRIREQFADELASGGDSARRQMTNVEGSASLAKSALVGALHRLREFNRPLLIILDTFEQVEAGGMLYTAALRTWLTELAYLSGAPEVRVLVSGRTDPTETSFTSVSKDDVLPLEELKLEGAVELLASLHVAERAAAQLHATFGGNPLVLRLLADLISRLGPAVLEDVIRDAQEGKLPSGMVQGILYDRFLKHIDAPADAYAHPGLVLPEITVDLIRHVLGPVQSGRVLSEEEAKDIFDALAKATWLVRVSPSGALTQRRDLRQLMLQLMNSDPARASHVDEVRRRAIEYHSRFTEPQHRAFVVYHRLMGVSSRHVFHEVANESFHEIGPWLRPHIDDLNGMARAYVQSRMLRSLGAEEAMATLPDDAWTRYLAGDGNEPGEGDRLVQAADPMIALALWRKRPVRVDGQLPVFVLQALAETAEWHDEARKGSLDVLKSLDTDTQSTLRLYWLTRIQLLRGKPLSGLHLECLSKVQGGDRAEHISLTAVAEAREKRQVIPDHVLEEGQFSSETRVYLVHSTRFGDVTSFRPATDALVVIQSDWAERVMRAYPFDPSMWARLAELAGDLRYTVPKRTDRFWRDWIRKFRAVRAQREFDVTRHHNLRSAQDLLATLDGAPLDTVATTIRSLRQELRVSLSRRDAAAQVLLLRGLTPEFYRPIRQALCEAINVRTAQIEGFMRQLRPAFTICPNDLEPEAFIPRVSATPTAWFLSLVQFADRARVIETLLDCAVGVAPDHEKLRRVRDAWIAWDRAICNGLTSDWIKSAESEPPAATRLVEST